jgi:hypothetical protein
MNKKILYGMAIFLSMLIVIACKKSKDADIDPPTDENTVTLVGTPNGAAVKKIIGQQGGEVTSADGTLKLIIPAGAVDDQQEFSVQSITNHLPGGIGNAFRILPHGEQFKKPVTIKFSYNPEDSTSSMPEILDIAYQDTAGSWITPMNAALDKNNHTISITTTHFSDWGFFKSLNLTPEEAQVELGGSVDLIVTTRFPYIDPDDVPAGQPAIKVLKEPRELRPHEIKKWSYAGDGILISRVSQAFYTAPDEEPEANPEAVTAHIHMARKGQFMLISNITVLGGHNIAYLHVDEDYKSPINNGDCRLYMYGNFGADPGAAKRSVMINGTTVAVDLWSPQIIRCKIDREIAGAIEIISNNKTVAQSVLRKYTGQFVYERFQGGRKNAQGSQSALKELTEFKIVYRGFGAPCPSNIDPVFLFEDRLAAFGTRADYTLSGSAAVTTPGACPTTTSVALPTASGIQLLNTITGSPDNRLDVSVNDVEGGIEVVMEFMVVDVITGVRVKRANCNSTSLDPARPLGVGLEGFDHRPIQLSFTEQGALKLKGVNELKSENMSSSILIEAWDGTSNHYETDGLMPATFRNK